METEKKPQEETNSALNEQPPIDGLTADNEKRLRRSLPSLLIPII
jgi:hypothetical protein